MKTGRKFWFSVGGVAIVTGVLLYGGVATVAAKFETYCVFVAGALGLHNFANVAAKKRTDAESK